MQIDQSLIVRALNSAGGQIHAVQGIVDLYRGFAAKAKSGKAFRHAALDLERELRIFVSTGVLRRECDGANQGQAATPPHQQGHRISRAGTAR